MHSIPATLFVNPSNTLNKALSKIALTLTLKTLLMCGIYAGLRIPSEVLNLTWADIDLIRGRLTVLGAYAKNGKTAIVPLTSNLHEALETLKRSRPAAGRPDRRIWYSPARKASPTRAFRTSSARPPSGPRSLIFPLMFAGIRSRPGWPKRGVDLRTIQELGRWASLSMVQRYSNISETHKTQAIEKLPQPTADESKPADIANRNRRTLIETA